MKQLIPALFVVGAVMLLIGLPFMSQVGNFRLIYIR